MRHIVRLDIIEALILEAQDLGYQVTNQLFEIADQDRAIYTLRHDHTYNGRAVVGGQEFQTLQASLEATLESMRSAFVDLQKKHREVIEKLEALAKS